MVARPISLNTSLLTDVGLSVEPECLGQSYSCATIGGIAGTPHTGIMTWLTNSLIFDGKNGPVTTLAIAGLLA
jgi:hypothetical protein